MIIAQQTYNPIALISAPKIPTDLLWQLSYLFVGLAVLYFFFVFFFRNRLTSKRVNEKNRKRELTPMISEFLFHEAESTKEENTNYINLKIEIRQLLKDDFNRKILSEILLDLRKDVAGETQKRVFKLYQDLGLHHDAFEKLKSKRWQIVSKAILDLTQMQVIQAYSFVTKFINDKRATIRRQAEIAVVTLKPEGINYFLDTTKYKISEWQQLKILDVLRMQEDFLPPPFKAWLTSTNRHVVLFALRLIKFYNQNDAKAALIELVKHKNNQIKEEAIACIKEFHITEALDTLKLVFWKCSIDVKIAILDAIGFLGTDTDIEFLRLIEKKEANFSVKSKALSSINAIVPDSIMPSKDLLNTTNYKIPEDIIVKTSETEEPENQPDEISNQTAVKEIKKEIEETSITKNTTMRKPNSSEVDDKDSDNSINDELLNFEFLPLVVQEDINIPISKTSIDLNEIEVVMSEDSIGFEDITPENENETINLISVEISEEELAFLPIVTENIEELAENLEVASQTEISIHDIEVEIDEVLPFYQEFELEKLTDYSEFLSSEILDIEVDINDTAIPFTDRTDHKIEELKPTVSMSPKEEQILKNVITDLISFDNHEHSKEDQDSPLLEFGNEFISPTELDNNKIEELTTSNFYNDKKIEENTESKFIIPKSILDRILKEESFLFNETSEESRIQLLEDIAAMGDERELPLLDELLKNKEYSKQKSRITEIIKMFSEVYEKPKPVSNFKNFNVFKDLFRTCDIEAKLILMDEIMAVGDESDIEFLEELMKNEQGPLKQKAEETLSEVLKRLSIKEEEEEEEEDSFNNVLKNESEVKISEEDSLLAYEALLENLDIKPSNEEHEMFDLTFELTEFNEEDQINHGENSLKTKDKRQISLKQQICLLSNKIIDKLNG